MSAIEIHRDLNASILPTEVWSIVGEKLQFNKRSLLSLIKTCRTFQGLFTPLLHSRHTIFSGAPQCSGVPEALLPLSPVHIKELDITLPTIHPATSTVGQDLRALRLGVVSYSLRMMPNIHTLRWHDHHHEYVDQENPPQVLRLPKSLAVLQDSTALRNLSVIFPQRSSYKSHMINPVLQSPGAYISFQGFKNLTVLELFGLHGGVQDTRPTIHGIVDVLHKNPHLETFGIGMECGGNGDSDVIAAFLIEGDERDFFKDLCMLYATRPQVKPLALKTLKLGFGMILDEAKEEDGNYLSELIEISTLETLHIWNGVVTSYSDAADTNEPPDCSEHISPEWSLLEGCLSLRQLSVTLFHDPVMLFLNFEGRTVRELIITHTNSMYDNSHFRSLSKIATDLTTVVIWERVVGKFGIAEDGMNDLPDFCTNVPVEKRTVLDRLPNHGKRLERLSLCLDFDKQFVNFCGHLGAMQNLRQLRISRKSGFSGQFPRPSNLWPNTTTSKSTAKRYAQLLKWVCPSLHFIRIEYWAWDVSLDHGRVPEADIYTTIQPLELEWDEMISIEIFAIRRYYGKTGVPEIQKWTEVPSE